MFFYRGEKKKENDDKIKIDNSHHRESFDVENFHSRSVVAISGEKRQFHTTMNQLK